MIRDTEGNSGLLPVPPMDGEALPTESDRVGSEERTTGADDACEDATGNIGDTSDVATALREGSLASGECTRRVGYTIDMSVNLGNSSHFDVHDASQGFAVWAEEVPGFGENWFFVLPNVHGLKPDGVTKQVPRHGGETWTRSGHQLGWPGGPTLYVRVPSGWDGIREGWRG